MTDKLKAAAQQALEAWDTRAGIDTASKAFEALRTAIEQALSNKENIMPITDDHGVATTRQFRVIEQRGRWQLLFDMHQIGNTVHHEFRIQKLRHDIVLYPGISLADAKQRFAEKVEADDE